MRVLDDNILSERHIGCLQLLADGFDIDQIAYELEITLSHALELVSDVRMWLSTLTDEHSVAIAIQRGIIH